MLQDALRRADRHKPYHVRPVNVSDIDNMETSVKDSGTTRKKQPKEEDSLLFNVFSSVRDLLPCSYCEQS